MDNYDSIEFLKKQFLCCTPLNKFKWPDLVNNADTNTQKQIIDSTVNSKIVLKYPIKQSYIKMFLKILVNKLEQSGVEIDDYVYNTYCDIISYAEKESSMHYRHFIIDDQDKSVLLTLKESNNIISQGTTGLCSWKAAFCLAEWCIANKEKFRGKNILELGSGVGLTGLTIVSFCKPKTYCFSDCHLLVLRTLEENIRLNLLDEGEKFSWTEVLSNDRLEIENKDTDVGSKVKVLNLKWEDIDNLSTELMSIDFVIAADIVYDNSTFDSLAYCLKKLIAKTVNYAIVAATIRNETSISEFLNVLDKYNLAYEDETTLTPQIFIQPEDTPIRILKIFKAK